MKRLSVLIFVISLFTMPVMSQVLLEENFDNAAIDGVFINVVDNNTGQDITQPQQFQVIQPEGWTITAEIDPADVSAEGVFDGFSADFPYPAWSALFYEGEWDNGGGDRNLEKPFLDGIMVSDSDRFGNLAYRTWLNSPSVDFSGSSIIIEFDNHYRHNDNQVAQLDISWDGGATYTQIFSWDDTNHNDNESYVGHETFAVVTPEGASSFTLRFFFGGDSDQRGFTDFDWYWAFDNLLVRAGGDAGAPAVPALSISIIDPNAFSGIVLTSSAFSGSADHVKSEWQVALDEAFENLIFASGETEGNLVSIEIPSDALPVGQMIYARVRHLDSNGFASAFSAAAQTSTPVPAGISIIEIEDFESTDEWSLPEGWKEINFNDPLTGDANEDNFATWSVVTEDTMASIGGDRVNVPVYEGKSVFVDADAFNPFQDAHLFSKRYDLTGVTNVWLTFGSNYVQNQDNIGALEYSVDGGDLSNDRTPTGTWLPLLYYLDTEDITYNEDGTPNAAETFRDDNVADGTAFAYNYWVFATPIEDMGPYIANGYNDNKTANKSFLKFRLEAADEQSNVVIRWSNMGTDSWFWGVDNVTIWGTSDTGVSEWSLY